MRNAKTKKSSTGSSTKTSKVKRVPKKHSSPTRRQSVLSGGFISLPNFLKKRTGYIVFVVLFATIASYLLIFGHAATSTIATSEVEGMSLPTGASIINDTSASNSQAIKFITNGTASGSVLLTAVATNLVVRAKGVQCKGAPQLVIKVDGSQVLTSSVSASSWTDYSATVNLAAATHNISIAFTNDNNRNGCSRDLYVDKVTFYGTVTAPMPSVSLTASPTSVSAGATSTLTWSSSNASSCTVSNGWSGAQSTSGSVVTPAITATTTYALSCTGLGGTTSTSVNVTVAPLISAGNTYFPTAASGQCLRSGGCTVATGLPRSDSYCAANIIPTTWEPRSDNNTANHTQGPASLSSIPWGPLAISGYWLNSDANVKKVDGYYTGVTTQIIQWAACKWGVDEDTMRAVAVTESYWHQNEAGDVANGCAHSFSIIQVRDTSNANCPLIHNSEGGMPYTQNSTALALDFYGARFRSCYDGDMYDGGNYLYGGQTAAQVAAAKGWDYVFWGCVGTWYSGGWYDAGATNYINVTKAHLANKDWATVGF